jgi:anti-sigma factor RsiW
LHHLRNATAAQKEATMKCKQSEFLLHRLIDAELDADCTIGAKTHVAYCRECAETLTALRRLRETIAAANLKETAPVSLRARIETVLPQPSADIVDFTPRKAARPARRSFFGGFAAGAILSSALAASLALTVFTSQQQLATADEVVSAHIRSLQAGHLIDVATSDQHTVKPWFNGRLDIAPPVVDLAAQDFALVGGRLDYIKGEPAASVVYQRRKHIINLFVAQRLNGSQASASAENIQGYNCREWSEGDLTFWAVSDIASNELDEFRDDIEAALHPAGAT